MTTPTRCRCGEPAVEYVRLPLKVGETFRYPIGPYPFPLAIVESLHVDQFDKAYALVGFWYMGRQEHGISTRKAYRIVRLCAGCATSAKQIAEAK